MKAGDGECQLPVERGDRVTNYPKGFDGSGYPAICGLIGEDGEEWHNPSSFGLC